MRIFSILIIQNIIAPGITRGGLKTGDGEPHVRRRFFVVCECVYSTVTDLARFLGLSMSHPRIRAT